MTPAEGAAFDEKPLQSTKEGPSGADGRRGSSQMLDKQASVMQQMNHGNKPLSYDNYSTCSSDEFSITPPGAKNAAGEVAAAQANPHYPDYAAVPQLPVLGAQSTLHEGGGEGSGEGEVMLNVTRLQVESEKS